jgi:cytochrome P450 family 6
MSPTFATGNVKRMFPIIKDCGNVLVEYLVQKVKTGADVVEFIDLMARFNTSIISTVAFGIDNDCINDPDDIVRKMGSKVFESTLGNAVRGTFAFLAPTIYHKMKLRATIPEVEDFIFSIVDQTVEHREKNNVTRKDFMQLLIQLKNQGYVSVDEGIEHKDEKPEGIQKKLTMNQLYANVFAFFVAGFETASSTLSFCLFELARNPEIQKKVQQEVDRVFKAHSIDEITYEMLSDLKYLENCVDETLRKYPVVPILFRAATRDYKVAESDLIIPKGTPVMIPILGIHRDPEIFENPMEFKPERFENSPNGNGNSEGVFYAPFGEGPRNCIAMRHGKLTTKLGLALIMRKFQLELNDKTMIDKELEFNTSQFVLSPTKPFEIKVTLR